jgi:glycosyltransferase involved in cell wall biosynthesis
MVVAIVVPFLNEERYLGDMLTSIAAQERKPDRLVLVDDGSTDRSGEIAEEFAAAHDFVSLVPRPRRAKEADRLATAAELKAFEFGVESLAGDYDIVAKLDADLELRPSHVAEMERRFDADPELGIAGAFLSARLDDGTLRRNPFPPDYVLGSNKFYRRACWEAISPLPPILGWDSIDVVRAHRHGWRTRTFELPDGDSVQLRRTGSHDGRLRGFRRWGECAWGVGSHPLVVLAGAATRVTWEPYLIGSANYLAGWGLAAIRRAPRSAPEDRAFKRREDLARLRGAVRRHEPV